MTPSVWRRVIRHASRHLIHHVLWAHYLSCIQMHHPSCIWLLYSARIWAHYPLHIQACYPLCMHAWICLWHFYAFLQMFYYSLYFFSKLHSTILTLSTNYELLEVLTMGDGNDEVGWWWLVEESESLQTCQCVWCYCMRSWNVGYSGGTKYLMFQLLKQ